MIVGLAYYGAVAGLIVAAAIAASAVHTEAQSDAMPPSLQVPANFVDETVDPQEYVDRYNAEESFREWFDANYPEYGSIYHAVGLPDPGAAPVREEAVAVDGEGEEAGPPAATALPPPLPRLDVLPAPFVDPAANPQEYVDRYNTDEAFREWFDANYSAEYPTIYRAVALPDVPAPFVDPAANPQEYVDRYNTDEAFREWFDANYPEYGSIYHAVGLPDPQYASDTGPEDTSGTEPAESLPPPVIAPGVELPPGLDLQPGQEYGECGEGTELVDGYCVMADASVTGGDAPLTPEGMGAQGSAGGGCLIATAAYGSELAPQVQMLREIRDGHLMQTRAGTSFMDGFNHVYYSFSPYVADYERENPAFRDAVRMLLIPLLHTLAVMEHADSEQEVLAYGIAVILANIIIYAGAPAAAASLAYGRWMRKRRRRRMISYT